MKCDTLELDTSDATIFPRYRTVCSWLKVWKKDQLRVLNSLSEDKNEELDSLDVGNNIEIIDYKFVNYNDSDLINFLNDSYLVDIANSDNFPPNESKEKDKSNETNQKLIEIIK